MKLKGIFDVNSHWEVRGTRLRHGPYSPEGQGRYSPQGFVLRSTKAWRVHSMHLPADLHEGGTLGGSRSSNPHPPPSEPEKGALLSQKQIRALYSCRKLGTSLQPPHRPVKRVFRNLGNFPSDLQIHSACIKFRKWCRLWSQAEPALARSSQFHSLSYDISRVGSNTILIGQMRHSKRSCKLYYIKER